MANNTSDVSPSSTSIRKCIDHGNFWLIETVVTFIRVTCFLATFSISTSGNLVISYIVIRTRRLWTFTNVMMVNYSTVSILFLLASLLQFISDFSFGGTWPFGDFLCKMSHSAFITTVIVSAFTMTAICYARYQACCKPLGIQPKVKHAKYIIVIMWIAGIAYMLPYAITLETGLYKTSYYCFLSNLWKKDLNRTAYDCILFIISYVIPIVAVGFFNIEIIRHVNKDILSSIKCKYDLKTDGLRCHHRNRNIDVIKKKLCKMSVILFIIYLIVWLPFWIYAFLINNGTIKYIVTTSRTYDCHIVPKILIIRIFTKYLTCFHSIGNIFICYYYNPPFSFAFKSMLGFKRQNSREPILRSSSRTATNV